MSRSIGDYVGSEIGVIALHVVSYRKLVESDEFMVFASDGV